MFQRSSSGDNNNSVAQTAADSTSSPAQITHEVGIFIKTMDSVLEQTDKNELGLEDFGPLHENLEWLVKFALAVAKVSKSKEVSCNVRRPNRNFYQPRNLG